jgi:two-component system, cell cycle response regulator DivK
MSYILLVEDNQANADMMMRILNTHGFEVRHYIKGLDGARAARAERPDVILMDFNLPDIDGRTLVLTLKQQLGGLNSPPIIAVTARTGAMEETLAKRFGCDAFISKPFDPQAFLSMVIQFVERTHARGK